MEKVFVLLRVESGETSKFLAKKNSRQTLERLPARGSRHADLVVIAVAVSPSPILFLLFGWQFAEIAVRIAMIFVGPLVVIDHFVMVPDVIVAVVGVIDPVVMMFGAGCADYGCRQGGGQKK